MAEKTKKPIFLCGPTAAGKSGLAIKLATAIDGEIVNGDAYQVYRGLEILTAAPTAAERELAPHHLFGILDPSELSDAANHRKLALEKIAEIKKRNKYPIIVGGSGLYLKFLSHGPSPVPKGDNTLRTELNQLDEQQLVFKLQKLDPVGAENTNLKNRRYVTRALEICMLTGSPMSSLKTNWENESRETEKNLSGVSLQIDRCELSERIRERAHLMLVRGGLDEVANIKNASTTCEKAIGFREIKSYLRGELLFDELLDLIHIATRQYAKRQRTWFKREHWLHQLPYDTTLRKLRKTLKV